MSECRYQRHKHNSTCITYYQHQYWYHLPPILHGSQLAYLPRIIHPSTDPTLAHCTLNGIDIGLRLWGASVPRPNYRLDILGYIDIGTGIDCSLDGVPVARPTTLNSRLLQFHPNEHPFVHSSGHFLTIIGR